MKRIIPALLSAALLVSLAACAPKAATGETVIELSDSGVTVNGSPAGTAGPVAAGGELIYYHDGTDETYGAGGETDRHTAEEAAAHTLVTITEPGTYRVRGTLTKGQLFIDLGEDAKADPTAVVNLILDNADISCTVAPAVFFYRVYECADPSVSGPDVDTAAAGANVILADGSENHITGSHVAKIYQPGTTDKQHKYDGAFYSRMTMNINGEAGDASGALYITADHEGLDSECHLTINGGCIFIDADNDGINTNEDGVSVTTINGGLLTVNGGLGAEGDGIDSNGYLTINGGTVWATSNETSPDGGIDADCAITINGGSVSAFGTRNDSVSEAGIQPSMELNFAQPLPAGTAITIQRRDGEPVIALELLRSCQSVTLSDSSLMQGETYEVLINGELQTHTTGSFAPRGGRPDDDGRPPQEPPAAPPNDGQQPPDLPDDAARPEPPTQGEPPTGMAQPKDGLHPEAPANTAAASQSFTLTTASVRFENVAPASAE